MIYKNFQFYNLINKFINKFGAILVRYGNKLQSYADDLFYSFPKVTQLLLRDNIKFKNKHKDKRAFVVANGPSLSRQNLALLKNEITFTMSGIWKHPDIGKKWNPTYYCLSDPIFFEWKEGFDSIKIFFKNIKNKLKKTDFFMPYLDKVTIKKYRLLPINKTHYVLFKGCLDNSKSLVLDLIKPIPGVQSTAQFAIELAIYMGCSPIYLIGFDHDWLSKRGIDRHFYQGNALENHPKVHGNLDKISYKEDMRDCLTLWLGYEKLLEIAQQKNIQIFNATTGGFLDVFPRINYNSIDLID